MPITTPFDPTAVDFNERREFNGRLLFNAYLNLIDGKIANMKMLLGHSKESINDPDDPDTRPRILLRMKDLGFALGPSLHLNRIKPIFAMGAKYVPELFEDKGIISLNRKKNRISISWNDIHLLRGVYEKATYFDLKWMARKIAALNGDDLEWSLIQAGVPVGVAKIYRNKLISRRNEIIKAFELEEDPDFDYPKEIPDLPGLNYQGDEPDGLPEVVNGEVARSHFTGKQVYLKNKSTILYNIITQAGNGINLLIDTFSLAPGKVLPLTDQLAANPRLISGELAGGGTTTDVTQSFGEKELGTPMIIKLGVGINASLSRRVLITPDLHTDRDCKARPFYVRDTLSITLGVGTPMVKKLLPMLPFELNGKIKFLDITFEHDHYSEKYLRGFITSLKPFLKSLTQPIEQAATQLDRMEVIRRSISFGLEGGITSSLFDYSPFALAQAKLGAGILKIDDRSYFRDQFGHLHAFTQNTHKSSAGIDLTVGQVSNPIVFRCPVLGYLNNNLKYKTEQNDLVALSERDEYSSEFPLEDDDGRLRDDLKKIDSGKTPPEELEYFKRNFTLKGDGEISYREKILFLNARAKKKRKTVTEIDYSDGHKKKLVLHATRREKYVGISSSRTILPFIDLAVKNAQRVNINVEMDEYNYPGSVIILRVMDFFRHGSREDTLRLIDSLNRRFSITPESPFYRDYELPSADEVDDYRKIYGVTRIYMSTSDLLDRITALDSATFKGMAEDFFSEQEELKTKRKTTDLNFFKRFLRNHKNKDNARRLVKYFEDLRHNAAQLNRDYKKIAALIDKFIFHQQIHNYGTSLLLKILGEDSLVLTGDIGGVFPSFSVANDLQERQRRRFAAKHWGNLSVVAPIQFHNRYERVLYTSDFVPIHITQDAMFGQVTNGYPEEVKAVQYN
ncbi:MAG: hypothetical protein ABIQ95_00360 [Bdellovibrionia bacterium]